MTVTTKELLATTPETLATQQRAAIISEVQATFSRLISHLEKGEFDQAQHMLACSPSGDGHGYDNMCISFDHMIDAAPNCGFTDIGDIIQRLRELAPHVRKGKSK